MSTTSSGCGFKSVAVLCYLECDNSVKPMLLSSVFDFLGGPGTFELVSRFCYKDGNININPYTAPHLFCAAHYMEMNETISGSHNLLEQTKKSIDEIKFWSWPELLSALKNFRDLVPVSSSTGILQKCMDSLVARLVYTSETSPSCPSSSSPESLGIRLSTDSKSTESLRSGFLRPTWWFEDLVSILTPNLVKLLVKSIVLYKFDNGVTSRFLFYYQKSRFITATSDEKREITETIIDSLSLLDQNAVSCKSLFGILRVALNLNVKNICKNNLECMIGSQLDQATLDNLLVSSPHGSNYLYDVNLVLQ
ncbi:BTB/POZ-like protein, partial [Tanacetum coccineum]